MSNNNEYNSSNIQVLEGLEPVRTRPGMYIGSVGINGLHHLIWEILDNSVDEAVAGYCNLITIELDKDGFVNVEDNGRGIPTDIHPHTKKSGVETVLTTLHAGGKFDSKTYQTSGGLHGVGASVVNALSEKFKVWVKRNGNLYFMEFQNGGNPIKSLEIIEKLDDSNKSGTKISFKPDFSVMDKNDFNIDYIFDRCQQIALLNKGLTIVVIDNRNEKPIKKQFFFEGGIIEYVNLINKNCDVVNKNVIYSEGRVKGDNQKDIIVEVAMQYTTNWTSNVVSYTNNISTTEGGTHEKGFYNALVRILNKYAGEHKLLKNETEKIEKNDVQEGLTAIISIKHTNPIFEGQTKTKLGNLDASAAVNKVFSGVFERFLNENPDQAKAIVEKTLIAQRARFAGAAARESMRKKNIFDVATLPGKLADCSTKNAEISEIYIVEGNSAGGSAKLGRDRETQAILPLRGKVINAEKARVDKVLDNEEIATIIHALGVGVYPEININKLRYHKIIIMTDADVDGSHIRILLLTFFYRYLKPLIEYGFVYIAQPPLFKISYGRTFEYAFNEEEKDVIIKRIEEKEPNTKISIQRYKGLGEMNPEQLWETTMDPSTRKMLQVQIEDAAVADSVFTVLMGDNVEPRREFIEENAKFIKNLDI